MAYDDAFAFHHHALYWCIESGSWASLRGNQVHVVGTQVIPTLEQLVYTRLHRMACRSPP
jgi:hypothetical protein